MFKVIDQGNHNSFLNEGVLLEVFTQHEDVIYNVHHIVVIDLGRQVLEHDVEQIIEFALDVAVSVQEGADAIGCVALARHQCANVREHIPFFMAEVFLYFLLVLLEKANEHLPDAAAQLVSNGIKSASTPLSLQTSAIERSPKPSEMPRRDNKVSKEGWAVMRSLKRASLEKSRDFISIWINSCKSNDLSVM